MVHPFSFQGSLDPCTYENPFEQMKSHQISPKKQQFASVPDRFRTDRCRALRVALLCLWWWLSWGTSLAGHGRNIWIEISRFKGQHIQNFRRSLILESYLQDFPTTFVFPITLNWFLSFFSPNSFRYRGSYFKYRGEGSQILWIRFGGAVGQGVVWCVYGSKNYVPSSFCYPCKKKLAVQ